ncbi:MAG: prepilin-type N-terminal cleavage/methylation domain-containing protein [Patescibacteria group bacterium]
MIGSNKKNFQFSIFNFQKSEGFTLIELIVAMAVFSTVITIVSSIFVRTVGSQRKNINQQEVLENARYVLEIMGRAIRQSSIQTANGTSDSLDITHPVKNLITYQLDNGQIKETSGGITDALTSPEVLVDGLSFIVQGNELSTKPRVTIVISLNNAQPSANANSIKLQTTITPRN